MKRFEDWFGAFLGSSLGISIGLVFGILLLCGICFLSCSLFYILGSVVPTPTP